MPRKKLQGAADVEFHPAEEEVKEEEQLVTDAENTEIVEGLAAHDLIVCANVITASAQRGIIRPEEMATVGATYNRLVKFLIDNNIVSQTAQDEEEEVVQGDEDA